MSYATVEASEWGEILDSLRDSLRQSHTLEEGAQLVARTLRDGFADTTALARVYAIIPYDELPGDVASFVDALATSSGAAAGVQPKTPVLALLGTYGAEEPWCDRRRSAGHKGIPLLSAEFVSAIPMIARLLKELGIDLAWLDEAPEVNARKLLGGFNGVFYVDDAASARDSLGRRIIPAQDFVEQQRIKTVFGMGGFYPDGTMIVAIVFTREEIARAQLERLKSLISLLKGETFGAARARRFFVRTPAQT
jgi:hypothetical protein